MSKSDELLNRLRVADYDTPYLFDLCSEVADRIEQLEGALRPFAEAADVFEREYPQMAEKPATSCGIRFDALVAARLALNATPQDGKGGEEW